LVEKRGPHQGIIYPVRGRKEPELGTDVLMVMIPSELAYLARASRAREVTFSEMRLYHLYETRDGDRPPVTLSGPFLGAPAAVMGMEKLIVLGARRFWVLGWCGSLQAHLRIGDILIPFKALSEEGTSQHYAIGEKGPESDPELNRMLEEELQRQGLSFFKGEVWTTDAPYRETLQKVAAYQDRGVLAVDMEMSALMSVALYRSVALTGLLVVSDELFDFKWIPGFSRPRLKEGSRKAGAILLALARSLAREPLAQNRATSEEGR